MRKDIEFKTDDGVTLRGWHYTPDKASGALPTVVMAHGYSAVKEMYLDKFAEAFAATGLGAIVFDNRNFGASDGEPRQEIDPWQQVRDYRDAITFAGTLDSVDAERIGVWGSSYSGGHVLVIGAEKLSQWIDWTDRSTCIIFADGAGAAVVGPLTEPGATPGIGPVVWGSDGNLSNLIAIADRNSFIAQEGQAVFRWATTALYPVARAACERAGVDPADLAAFIPHQANLRIIEAIAKKLGAPQAKVATDIVHAGNTSSASIPLALSRMLERGELPSGAPALLLAFGAGISYAAQVITVP